MLHLPFAGAGIRLMVCEMTAMYCFAKLTDLVLNNVIGLL